MSNDDTTQPAWLHGHAHEPNPAPPTATTAFTLRGPGLPVRSLDVADLQGLAAVTIPACYIVSTGHGASGPFAFTGVRLADLLADQLGAGAAWSYVDVVSADGFGTRLGEQEVRLPSARPIVLAYAIDGAPLTREQGLVRLIVPSETDDALRQVKWVTQITVSRLGGSDE